MLKAYHPFCSIIVEHQFYTNGISNDLTLIPSRATSELMNRAHLRIRPVKGNEFVLYFGEEQTQEGPRANLIDLLKDGNLKLTFDLRQNNLHFFNFTLLPLQQSYQKYYFSNWEVTTQEMGIYAAAKLPAPPEKKKDYVGEGDLQTTMFPDLTELLAALPPPASDEDDPPLGSFLDTSGQLFYQWPLIWNKEDQKWMSGNINPPSSLHGMYLVKVGEQTTQPFIYTGGGVQASEFGLLELWLADNGIGENPFLIEGQPNKLRHLQYKIVFKNRPTYWRYHIIAKSSNGENGEKTATYEIKSNSGLLFEETTSQLADTIDDKVVGFKSENPIGLKQSYEKKEQLELLIHEPGSMVNAPPTRLPSPDPQNIKAVKEKVNDKEETHWYSEMYIYL